MKDFGIILLVTFAIMNLFCVVVVNNNNLHNTKELYKSIKESQTTIDSLIQKNERLNNGFLELYDDRAMMSIEMNELIRDNKYLKRITR